MLTLASFALALGLLITVHELGHYGVAVLCGVKILRFSIGFGKHSGQTQSASRGVASEAVAFQIR